MEKIKPQLRLIANPNIRDANETQRYDESRSAVSALEAVAGATDAEQGFSRLQKWLLSQVALQMEADRVEKQIELTGDRFWLGGCMGRLVMSQTAHAHQWRDSPQHGYQRHRPEQTDLYQTVAKDDR